MPTASPSGPARTLVELPWGPVSCLEWTPDRPSPATTVLLLHGGGLDSAWLSWGSVGGALAAAGHRVIAPDHPGYGQSPRAPWAATQQRLLDYVAALVDALALERYAVGGLSMGGGLAIGHVLAHPERVAGALLLGSYGLMPTLVEGPLALPAQLLSWATTRTGAMARIGRASARNHRVLERSLRPVLRDPRHRTPELLAAIVAEARRSKGLEVFGEWQRAEVGARRQATDYSDRLGSIAVPTLVIHGERDTSVPVRVARRAASAITDARLLTVADAGHWVQRDRPDIVIPAMLEFLDGLR